MTVVPEVSGYIIESGNDGNGDLTLGYHNSSLLFVLLSLIGVILSYLVFIYSTNSSFAYVEHPENISELEMNEQKMH